MKTAMTIAAGLILASGPASAHGPKATTHHAAAATAHQHEHGLLEIDAEHAPRVAARVEPDAKSGLNIFLVTENFTFAPELVNQPHVDGHGHAHIYVDGVKLGRIYGPAHHLEGLTPGEHRIEVTLNANDHREYAVNGNRITATTTVTIP